MSQFRCSSNNSLIALPPKIDGLTEHIKRACLQVGYEWRTPVEDVDFTDPTLWGWRFIDNKHISKWHDFSNTGDVNYLTKVCSCKKGLCKNFKCPSNKVNCLPYCGCNGRTCLLYLFKSFMINILNTFVLNFISWVLL